MQPSAYATSQREIRVFLSSTFRDMEHEREYLMSRVFPSFRKLCLQREVVFTEIDLRWGITQEAANNGRTVQICLEEIDRCRNLQLPPFFIGFLGERYGWIPSPEDLQHYWEQFPDSAYAPQIAAALAQGISVTELEVRFGFLDQAPTQAASRVLMLLRDPALSHQMAQAAPDANDFHEPALQPQLEQLKAAVRQGARNGKTALVDGYTSVESFGEAIHAFLVSQLDLLFPLEAVPTPLIQQQRLHDGYAASRLRNHVATPQLSNWFLEHLTAPDAPICTWLQGPSGSGKSAFMADFARRLHTQEGILVLQHFLAADEDHRLTVWRDRVLHTLQAQGWITHPLPETEYQRWQALPAWLSEVAQQRGQRILLVLDALDQATDGSVTVPLLAQLPWGPEVRLLVSATPEQEVPAEGWALLEMPALDAAARLYFARTYLEQFAKQLPETLLQRMMAAPACDTPLFLRTVLEEVRVRSRHISLAEDLEQWLAYPDTSALFLATLEALDQDYAPQGPALASRAARYLAASMQGLTQHTLSEMLAPPGQPRLPDRVLLPLLANLQPYLLQNQGKLQLQHAMLTEAIEQDRQALQQARQELLDHHDGEDVHALAEAAYQRVRMQLTTIEDDLRNGITDTASHVRTFEDYFLHDYQQKTAFLDSMDDLPTFARIWAFDSNVSYNLLQNIGAGKGWQPIEHQGALLDRWMASLEPLDADALCALRLDDLTIWFHQKAMIYLCREFAIRLLHFKMQHLPDHPAELAMSATLAAQMLLEHGHGLKTERQHVQEWLEQAQQWWSTALPTSQEEAVQHSLWQMRTHLQKGWLHYQCGQLPQALECVQTGLALQEARAPGSATLHTCELLDLRARIHAHLENFDSALQDAEFSLRVRVELQGQVHSDVAQSLYLFGHLHALQDQLDTAASYLERCIEMARQTKLELHPDLGHALHRLAQVYQQRGQPEQALERYEEAGLCWSQYLPLSDPRRYPTYLAMAKLHGEAGDLQEEQAQLRQLLKYFKFPLPNLQAPSDDSMRVAAQARLRTVQLLVAQDENEEAQRQWVQVLQLLRHHQLETDMQPMVERTRELLGPLARISFASRHYKSIELTGVWMSMPSFLLAPAPEDAAEGVYAA